MGQELIFNTFVFFITMSELFENRHLGSSQSERKEMLQELGVSSLEELMAETLPKNIRLKKALKTGKSMTEYQYLRHLRAMGGKNILFRSFIGQGYYNTFIPPVIQRNVFENPGWYTAYTPYQAEIAQGRLEALLNFQTVIVDFTSMPIANASLLDEATAAAEAMCMFFNHRDGDKQNARTFFVSDTCYPQTIDVLKTRALPFGIEIKQGRWDEFAFGTEVFGVLLQYPDKNGEVHSFAEFSKNCKSNKIQVAAASDLLALALLVPPGEWGADCVIGNSQRFGVPLGYGGPHAAFFACREEYKRYIPGRIIGLSQDAEGKPGLRMALQTREQHIKREKATSNICTAQALLAIMAGMYAVYNGPQGIRKIAENTHRLALRLAEELSRRGYKIKSGLFFDTVWVEADAEKIKIEAVKKKINFHYPNQREIVIALDETTEEKDILDIIGIFSSVDDNRQYGETKNTITAIEKSFAIRKSPYLLHPVFHLHRSETAMMRYIKSLENKDISLVHSMISLGSCTMKLNAAAELLPLTWPEFANLHPFVPEEQAKGYREIIRGLDKSLCQITGFAGMSFQPNSGAQGEYAGLLVIRAYQKDKGQGHRNIALIPSSAHGTNPASAAMAGLAIIIVKCDQKGNIDLGDLEEKATANKENLCCLMVTYPSTHGVFEEKIKKITSLIHKNGGQVYMDGANMNAQVGLTSPGKIGADVCHLNLHKTFAIPHGGGGPGMGPIGVAKHLLPYLPGHVTKKDGGNLQTSAVAAAPYGSALILLISYGYVKMLGSDGMKSCTENAILNANYMMEKLKDHYKILYKGRKGRCAHEFILDCSDFKMSSGVEVSDIAKRLMDYGFHAPTVAFPVVNTLMVEPTESEGKAELDRFCEAMIQIRKEIQEVTQGKFSKENNVVKNAPHTLSLLTADNWERPYSREKAAFPLNWLMRSKIWPSVARVDNAYGDRNLVCSCPPVESYVTEKVPA